ncbi:MAG: FAD:protein FMN transferase, partial [Muribaculaceae bacterium]|nr:FAD:protein FMN transferase [Muribaculaceae bacterium]
MIRQHATLPYVKNQGQVFGTYYHLTYQAEGDMQAVIEEQLKHVDEEFSMFNAQSTVSQLNRGEQPSLSESFVGVMKLADEVNKATSGAFDVTVAPLVNAWGFGFKTARMPSDDEVDSLLEFIGQDKIKLEQRLSGARLTKADPRVMLDFSAIAKGYGCDVVAATLRKNGVKNYLVEIGGEVVASGVNPNKQAWSVGVNKPVTDPQSNVNEIDTILTLTHGAIATSGNYRNFYV